MKEPFSTLSERPAELPHASGRLAGLRRLLHGPSRRCRQRILVVGQPKSGTTALFYSIRQALPWVPALFEPKDPQRIDPRARPLIVKSLINGRTLPSLLPLFKDFEHRILLLRDPRDRMISSFFYQLYHARFVADPALREALLTLLRQKEQDPQSLDFATLCAWTKERGGHDFFQGCTNSAHRFSRFLRKHGETFFKLTYEDLVESRLSAVSDYLGLELQPVRGDDDALVRVRRTAASGDWRNWLTEQDVAQLRPDLDPLLESLGYPLDWHLNHPERLDPARGSGYAERLIAARDRRSGTAAS